MRKRGGGRLYGRAVCVEVSGRGGAKIIYMDYRHGWCTLVPEGEKSLVICVLEVLHFEKGGLLVVNVGSSMRFGGLRALISPPLPASAGQFKRLDITLLLLLLSHCVPLLRDSIDVRSCVRVDCSCCGVVGDVHAVIPCGVAFLEMNDRR